jgi:hypothetical protein
MSNISAFPAAVVENLGAIRAAKQQERVAHQVAQFLKQNVPDDLADQIRLLERSEIGALYPLDTGIAAMPEQSAADRPVVEAPDCGLLVQSGDE